MQSQVSDLGTTGATISTHFALTFAALQPVNFTLYNISEVGSMHYISSNYFARHQLYMNLFFV
jgi:hypothetical protein